MTSKPLPRSREGYQLAEIPRFVTYASPVIDTPQTPSPTANLPLNLLALIISFLDDVADISRVTRTSRLLYYMTLPQLYKNVSLHAYPEIKYNNGRPEGYGGGSPFTMAINGLATKNNVTLTNTLRIWGELKETGSEEFAQGRIPDNIVMLNTLLRIVVDKATRLHKFSWDLAAKPTKTLYQGLSARSTLTSLTIRCPSTRIARPVETIPAMPNLRAFKFLDFDPLCQPDDISLLILESKKLTDLRIHFSPRMRQAAEATIKLDAFFEKCYASRYIPQLKHFALQNYFGPRANTMTRLFDEGNCKSICFLDTFGGARTIGANVFVDDTWKDLPRGFPNSFSTIRFNEPAPQHVTMLENATVLVEHFYFVNHNIKIPTTPPSLATPGTSPLQPSEEVVALGKEYLHVLTRKHGSSLKHLLLCEQWALSQQEIGDVVRLCPNLEQLAIGLDGQAFEIFRIVIQFLRKLTAVRVFENDHFRQLREEMTPEQKLVWMGRDFYRLGQHNIKYIGAGSEFFKVGGLKEITNDDGNIETIQDIIPQTFDQVKHVEIWGMDRLDLLLEPDFDDTR